MIFNSKTLTVSTLKATDDNAIVEKKSDNSKIRFALHETMYSKNASFNQIFYSSLGLDYFEQKLSWPLNVVI